MWPELHHAGPLILLDNLDMFDPDQGVAHSLGISLVALLTLSVVSALATRTGSELDLERHCHVWPEGIQPCGS